MHYCWISICQVQYDCSILCFTSCFSMHYCWISNCQVQYDCSILCFTSCFSMHYCWISICQVQNYCSILCFTSCFSMHYCWISICQVQNDCSCICQVQNDCSILCLTSCFSLHYCWIYYQVKSECAKVNVQSCVWHSMPCVKSQHSILCLTLCSSLHCCCRGSLVPDLLLFIFTSMCVFELFAFDILCMIFRCYFWPHARLCDPPCDIISSSLGVIPFISIVIEINGLSWSSFNFDFWYLLKNKYVY